MKDAKKSARGASYLIPLPDSEDWGLEEFYQFPHTYDQCYAFIYCLDTDLPARDQERIDNAFAAYPWRGGYSYVNIYTVLRNQLPPSARPKVASIHKASPGWLELLLNLEAATTLAKSVAVLAGAGVTAVAAYAKASKILGSINAERERARLRELQLTKEQIKAVRGSCEELAKAMGFRNLAELHRRTGDPEVTLRLLGAHYRRMRLIVEYVDDEKVRLPLEPGQEKLPPQ